MFTKSTGAGKIRVFPVSIDHVRNPHHVLRKPLRRRRRPPRHTFIQAAVRAIVSVQKAIKADISLTTEVARKSFPEAETALIAQVVERDLPYYDAAISPKFVTGMNAFSRDMGLMTGDPRFEDVVATQFSHLW